MIFAVIQAKLEALTQTMTQNRDKLCKVETRLENRNEREGKRGSLTSYQNDRYLTSTDWMYQLLMIVWIILIVWILKFFLNWLQSMNMYSIRYPFSEAEKVRFATMKLTGQAN